MRQLLLLLVCVGPFLCESCFAQSSRVYELRLDKSKVETNAYWFYKIYYGKDVVPGFLSRSTVLELYGVYHSRLANDSRILFFQAEGKTEIVERMRANQEIKLANLVPKCLEELGPEGQLLIMQHSNRGQLKHYAKRKGLQLDSSFLSNPKLRSELGVTAERYRMVEDELNEVRTRIYGSFKAKLSELQQKNLKAVEEVLDASQRMRFKNRFGEPIQWLRQELGNESFKNLLGMLNNSESGPRIRPRNQSVTREMRDNFESPDEFENENTPVVGYFLYSVLRSPFFHREMEFTQGQESQLSELLASWRESVFITMQFHKQRIQELLDGKAKYPDDLKEILLPHQLEWLPTCELQLYTAKHLFSFGLLAPTVIEAFELSPEQQKKLKTLANEYEKSYARLSGDLKKRLAIVLSGVFARSIKILDARQRERYKLLTGLR